MKPSVIRSGLQAAGFAALIGGASAIMGCSSAPPPPPPQVEVRPAQPSPRAVWVPGHWQWKGKKRGHVWVPGHWKVR